MSAQPVAKELDVNRLVGEVIEKTKAGKLRWKATANDNIFIVSVGGNTTIKVSLEAKEEDWVSSPPVMRDRARLILLDEYGNPLLDVWEDNVPAVAELFTLARRMALNVDERIQSLMEVLQKL